MPPPTWLQGLWLSLVNQILTSWHTRSTPRTWHQLTFFLFSVLKQKLCRRKFGSIPDVQEEVWRIFSQIDKEDFTAGIRELGTCWKKCIKVEGAFFEGKHVEVDPVSEAEFEETETESDSEPMMVMQPQLTLSNQCH